MRSQWYHEGFSLNGRKNKNGKDLFPEEPTNGCHVILMYIRILAKNAFFVNDKKELTRLQF